MMRFLTLISRGKSTLKLFSPFNSTRTFPPIICKKPNPNAHFSFSVTLRSKSISSSCFQMMSHLRRNPGIHVPKCISSSTANTVDWTGTTSLSKIGGGVNLTKELDVLEEVDETKETSKAPIPIRAFFFSTSVDLRTLVERNKQNFISHSSRMTNYVVLRFGDLKLEPNGLGANLSGSDCCYMTIFQYGSVVLFNVRDHDVDGYLKIVEKHASGLLPEMRKDEYEVREMPTLNRWMQGGLDYIMLQYLNIDGIRIIGNVLGQSIALDYYVHQVYGMLAEFTEIKPEKIGPFIMGRKKLFQLVGKTNSNLADVNLTLGLFERPDISCKDAKYGQIWEYLGDEFQLTKKFATLDIMLKYVECNIHLLEKILNRKSDFSKWLVISVKSALNICLVIAAYNSLITSL